MSHREVPYYHPQLRRLEAPGNETTTTTTTTGGGDISFVHSLMGQWIRVVLVDDRVFVGTLEALDGNLNLVLSSPVEVRPVKGKDGAVETKSHRGGVMIGGKHVCKVGIYKKSA